MKEIETIAKVALIIFLYYVVYAFYFGITHPIPAPGDSYDYHIPIQHTILDGSFLHPSLFTKEHYFALLNPGSSEAINALFILLQIPLTLSNLFAAIVLFFCLWKLGLIFKLDYYYALLFALTFSTLNVIVRWFNAISIDIWLAVFFCLAIILLENPKKSIVYFAKLGIVFGMLVGSKYSGWIVLVGLMIMYGKRLIKIISLSRLILFLVPFCLFGLFWYIRNYLAVGNPLWPFCLLSFPCEGSHYNSHVQMWDATLAYPVNMVNSLFAEYKLWSLTLLAPLLYIFLKKQTQITKLFLFGFFNFLFFLTFPTSKEPWVMVSSFRYSYTVFIPFILGIFLLAQILKKENLLGYFAIANMLFVTSFAYYPKLIMFYLPIAFLCFYFLKKHESSSKAADIKK